jgi:acyl-[acyl-carrier-protein]-phospholipid O-acyltransferase/long-chain-fatty-acid--[acyl-carrier-protein] ligase
LPCCFSVLWLDQAEWWVIALLVLALMGLAYLFRYPLFIRFPLWFLTHTLYRVRVHGRENIPATGPALLVSNHVSHIDAALIQAAARRPVRFLVWAPFLGKPLLRPFLKLSNVIPIDSSSGPRAIIQSLRVAGEALAKGEVVCIFAEGGITRTGFMLPFQRGMEQIVKRHPAPIIPVCLDHVWGSIFSYERRRFFWKWPKQLPYRVWVNFGKPLPPTATAFEVRQVIQNLSAESAVGRAPERRPVHRQFVRMAVRHPFRACFVDPNNAQKPILKYGEALVGAKILTKLLRPVLGDDKMVGLWLPPSVGGALANIVVAFLGKTAVNLNYTASPAVVQSAIRQCGIRKVLTSKLFTSKVPLDPGPDVELIYLEEFRKQVTSWQRIRGFLSVLLLPGFVQERWRLGLGKHTVDDLATVIFSSGSTGEPKGVMLTHGNIAANCESMIQAIDPGPKDRLLGILPFFHSFGYTVTLWVPLQVGASVVYHPNPLQAREIGEACRKYQCTIFLSTPTFLRSFIKRCEPEDFSSLRLLMCGAEKLPPGVAKDFQAKFGVEPLEGYGCTELSPAAAANVPDWPPASTAEPASGRRQVGNKRGTIGQPLPGVAARVVHKETLQPLPAGTEGLLLIYGANVMKGYLGRDELTREKIVDGWYVTGDLASIDEDGFITITGREERFAKVGGEMVPLEKVEEEIHSILKSSDRLAAVTAIPDPRKGERLIVLHLPFNGIDARQICRQLNDRGLPNLYVPGPRDFFPVAEIPILGSGKLDLKKCKEKAMEMAGGSGHNGAAG